MKYELNKYFLYRSKGVDQSLISCFLDAREDVDFNVQIAACGGFRTKELQKRLFGKGRDEAGEIIDKFEVVTSCDGVKKVSEHQKGKALDIVIYDNFGQPIWTESFYKKFNDAMQKQALKHKIKIKWGGTWGDFPHYQLSI